MGGSATTATILKMAVVFIAADPRVQSKLVKELDEADAKGLLSPTLQHKVCFGQTSSFLRDLLTVSKETSHLPYLTAILNETLRL